MFDAWAFAREGGVLVEWADLPGDLWGFYTAPGGRPPLVLLERSLGEVEARCVLAEELGHHVLEGHLYPIHSVAAPGALRYSVAESRALRWAMDRLMPAGMFLAELHRCRGVDDLAERFGVTPSMAELRAVTLARLEQPARSA